MIGRSRTFRGEVWTDASARATVVLPPNVDLVEGVVSYELEAADGARARVISVFDDGRFSIESSEPYVKVAWRLKARRPIHRRSPRRVVPAPTKLKED